MLKYLRNAFIAGLFVVLPVVVSLIVLFWAFGWADSILGDFLNQFLHRIGWLKEGTYIPGLGIVALTTVIFLIGILAHNYIGRKMIEIGEYWLSKIPIFRYIYNPTKQITGVFSNSDTAFRRLVLIEYPRPGIYSPGFLTGETFLEANEKTGQKLVTVFIPMAPNPTTGFIAFVPETEIIYLDTSVEEGFKMFLSAGVIQPENTKS